MNTFPFLMTAPGMRGNMRAPVPGSMMASTMRRSMESVVLMLLFLCRMTVRGMRESMRVLERALMMGNTTRTMSLRSVAFAGTEKYGLSG